MANPEHLAVVKQGAAAIRKWREENLGVPLDLWKSNLSGASLRDADLRDADLSGADLSQADLGGANLNSANLSGADLNEADLSRANLNEANLNEANLNEADLSGADLSGADLSGAELFGTVIWQSNLNAAELRNTMFGNTVLADVDLSKPKGLGAVDHLTPSTIGIDTLYRSGGNIPDVFLRGCGVPDGMITYARSLVSGENPIEFYSCFISYSHKDEEFTKRLHARMQQEKLRVWYAPEDMKRGEKIHEQIDHAIRIHDKLLLVLSEESMKSEWVETEIRKARKREVRDDCRVLFPIRLVSFEALEDWECFDAGTGKDMADEIREYYIPDFSEWKSHDKFEQEFAKLLRDLKPSTDEA